MNENTGWEFLPGAPAQASSETPSEDSDITEKDVAPHLECVCCQGRHQVTIAFKECKSTHATCTRCLKGLFIAKLENTLHNQYLPTTIKCPLCRANINHIGVFNPLPLGGHETVVVGGETFRGLVWVPLLQWMANEEEDIALALRMYYLAQKYCLEIRKVDDEWVIPVQQSWVPELSAEEITALTAIYDQGSL